jgi:hypothetical protein
MLITSIKYSWPINVFFNLLIMFANYISILEHDHTCNAIGYVSKHVCTMFWNVYVYVCMYVCI